MQKITKQVVHTNFTLMVLELEELIKQGYSVVKEGEQRPYSMVLGNFQVTLEKDVDDEICYPVSEVVEDVTTVTEIPEKEVVVQQPTKPQNQRGPKPKK